MNMRELRTALEKSKNDEKQSIEIKGLIASLAEKAESKIRQSGRDLSYATREWSIELILGKYQEGLEDDKNEMFIPDYQRDFKWEEKTTSRFIESILLDFPIPYLYIADVDNPDDPEIDGRIEIIDGSQRVRALHFFVNDQIELTDLKEIKELEGFKFSDLPASRRRRFLRETLRLVELKGGVDEDTRRDLFERINSGVKRLEAMEVRHGSQAANSIFYKDVISSCADSSIFSELAPLSTKKKANADHKELVLRFFAYINNLENYKGYVKPFLDEYLDKQSEIVDSNDVNDFIGEFDRTMSFIKENIPLGFRKTSNSKTTPRARYEAISVGTALALRENPNLEPAEPISNWITSTEFQKIVGADSANNISQLKARVNFVKNKLLGESE